jgi:hypothetical protein
MQYWLLGCQKLVVETDAMYIKGMLDNPGMGPNAIMNRWIEEILMFHFTLKHVKGLTFSPDGLSRRLKQPGDPEYPSPEDSFDENPSPEEHEDWDHDIKQPYEFDNFKCDIDTRGGYLQTVEELEETSVEDVPLDQFEQLCWDSYTEHRKDTELVREAFKSKGLEMPQFIMSQIREEEPMLPPNAFKFDPQKQEEYPEKHRTESGRNQDAKLDKLKEWFKKLVAKRPEGFSDKQYL